MKPPAPKPARETGHVPTIAEHAERYLSEHVQIRCKSRTVNACRWLFKKIVISDIGKRTIDAVDRVHIAAMYYKHRDTPYQANRILEVVRKMSNLAEAGACARTAEN